MQSHMSLALNVLDKGLKVRLDSAFSALNKSLQSVMSVYNYLQYFPTYCRGWHNEWKSGGAEICDLPFLQYMPHTVANWPSTIFPPGEIRDLFQELTEKQILYPSVRGWFFCIEALQQICTCSADYEFITSFY